MEACPGELPEGGGWGREGEEHQERDLGEEVCRGKDTVVSKCNYYYGNTSYSLAYPTLHKTLD